jgi:hypothetical protein
VTVVGLPGSREATIEGHVLSGAQHAKCELEYGAGEAYDSHVPCREELVGPGAAGATVVVSVTGLEPGTAYDYRLIVENSSGPSAPGEGKGTFTTQTATPLPGAESASEVGLSGALLSGMVAPEGTRTRYWFEYGATEALGESTPGGEVPAGRGEVQVTPEAISGLTPGTLYYYRLRAENQWHEAFGATQTFTTARSPSTTSPSGPEPGGSSTAPDGSSIAPLIPPLAPVPSTTPVPTGSKKAKKKVVKSKKVAKCKRGEKRERGRCLKKKRKRTVEKRSSPTSSRRTG